MVAQALLNEALQSRLELSSLKLTNLELILLPTEQCNFRCKYCYEDFNLKRMDSKVIQGIKSLLTTHGAELKTLKVQWFGGEPMLCYDIVKDLMEFINKDMPHPEGFRLESVMTTNGYFLGLAKLGELTNLGVKLFQISFDGDEDEHDKMRVRADGGPTFARIWGNLAEASRSDLDFSIMVRIHLNQNNYSSASRFLDRVSAELKADKRFKVYIRGLSKLGGPNDPLLPVLNETELDGVVSELTAKARGLGLNVVTVDSFSGEAGLPVCYASMFNSFVIRSDGRVGKCTVALYDDRNCVGRLNEDGTVDLDGDKILWWGRGNFSKDSFELTCPWVAGVKSKLIQLSTQ